MENYILNSFIKKYGMNVINDAKKMMKKEIENNQSSIIFNDDYFLYIFQIAFFEFCGIKTNKIPYFITRMSNSDYSPDAQFSQIRQIHSSSIDFIKSFLDSGTPDF